MTHPCATPGCYAVATIRLLLWRDGRGCWIGEQWLCAECLQKLRRTRDD